MISSFVFAPLNSGSLEMRNFKTRQRGIPGNTRKTQNRNPSLTQRVGMATNAQLQNMHLGVKFSQQDSFVTLEIFKEDQFRIAQDARSMSLEALGQKYPHVADIASKSLAEYKSSLDARRAQSSQNDNFLPSSEPSVQLEVDRAILLCSVADVGEDYVLITYGADNTKKQVIARQAISRIRWASDELRFRNAVKCEKTPN